MFITISIFINHDDCYRIIRIKVLSNFSYLSVSTIPERVNDFKPDFEFQGSEFFGGRSFSCSCKIFVFMVTPKFDGILVNLCANLSFWHHASRHFTVRTTRSRIKSPSQFAQLSMSYVIVRTMGILVTGVATGHFQNPPIGFANICDQLGSI